MFFVPQYFPKIAILQTQKLFSTVFDHPNVKRKLTHMHDMHVDYILIFV